MAKLTRPDGNGVTTTVTHPDGTKTVTTVTNGLTTNIAQLDAGENEISRVDYGYDSLQRLPDLTLTVAESKSRSSMSNPASSLRRRPA